jgi:hypothetical protein
MRTIRITPRNEETQRSRNRTEFYDFLCNNVYVHKHRINEEGREFGLDDRFGFVPDHIRDRSIKPGETYDHYTFRFEGYKYDLKSGEGPCEYGKINLTELFRDYNLATQKELEEIPQRTPFGRILVGRGIVKERIWVDEAVMGLRRRLNDGEEFNILGNKENWPDFIKIAPKLNLDSKTKRMLGRYFANEISRHNYTIEDIRAWGEIKGGKVLNWGHEFRDYKINGSFAPSFWEKMIRSEVGVHLCGMNWIEGEEQGITFRTWRRYCLESRRKSTSPDKISP